MLSPMQVAEAAGSGSDSTVKTRPDRSNAEVKISGPNGVVLDMSESGWIGN